MAEKNDLVFKKIAVDIGDLRVEFMGASEFLQSIDIASSPLHLHSKHELQYILSGSLQEIVNGDRLQNISGNTVLLIPPNMLHSNPNCEGKRFIATLALQQLPSSEAGKAFSEYTYYCELFGAFREPLVFQDSIVDHYIRQLLSLPDLPENRLFTEDISPVMATGDMADVFLPLFQTVLRELEEDKDFGYEIAQTTARIIVMRLFRLLNRDINAKELLRGNKVLQDALRYIDGHYTSDISLEELAAKCLVSKYYLSHLFTKSTGKSIGRYILDKRMYMAKYLLSSTDLSVEQVSTDCGFSDSAYFCRLFKKETGFTPTQYRKAQKSTC